MSYSFFGSIFQRKMIYDDWIIKKVKYYYRPSKGNTSIYENSKFLTRNFIYTMTFKQFSLSN